MPDAFGLVYALAYLFVTMWTAMPDGVHLNLYHLLPGAWRLLTWLGYIVSEDGSIGW